VHLACFQDGFGIGNFVDIIEPGYRHVGEEHVVQNWFGHCEIHSMGLLLVLYMLYGYSIQSNFNFGNNGLGCGFSNF
jgi:hypothetical protein